MVRRWLTALVLLALADPVSAQDSLDGIPIVDTIDAAALPAGRVHRLWFRAGRNAVAQAWLVPVIVVRGAKPGPKLLVTAGIHGDELTGIAAAHRLAAEVDPATLAGTLTLVPGLNIPGLLHHTRGFTPDGGTDGDNLNRALPGQDGGDASAGDRYAKALWDGLIRPNADAGIDLHTQSRGTAYPMYAFASTAATRRMAMLAAPDIVKLDPGVAGSVETELVKARVPAITLELGRPELFDAVLARRAADGVLRIMADRGMIAGAPPGPAGPGPFVGNKLAVVRTQRGGFATLAVALNSDVTRGQVVATVADAFGRVVETLLAPEGGRVAVIATNPNRDPGDMVVRVLFVSPDPKCAEGC